MSRQTLKAGVSCSFSQFFDLPFTIEDILAEFDCTIHRAPIDLPRKSLGSCHEITSQPLAALPAHLGLKPKAKSSSPLKRTKDVAVSAFNPF
jgi:hypothetical protein